MKIKRILAILLTVLLVLSSVPMMALSAETADDSKTMVHLTDLGGRFGYFAKGADLVVGESYVFTFRHYFNKGQFCWGSDGKGLALDLFFLNEETGTLTETNRGTRRDDYDPRRFGYSVVDGEKGIVSFSFTAAKHDWDEHGMYAANGETQSFAVGFTFAQKGEVDVYLSDFALYNANDPDKTNLLAEETGDLTGWYGKAFGHESGEDEGYVTSGPLSGTTYKGGTYHYNAEVLPFDESAMTLQGTVMPEPTAAPSRMIHFIPFSGTVNWENGSTTMGFSFGATAGATYYLSFHMATTLDPSEVGIKAFGDGARTDVDVSPQLVEIVDHSSYFWATYKISIPSNFQADGDIIILGFSLPSGSESYIYDINIYDPFTNNSIYTTELRNLSGIVYGKYLLWGGNYAYYGVATEDWTSYVVENGTGTLETVDFDSSNFSSLTKMLYFKYENGQAIQNRVGVTAGAEYKLAFDVTNSVTKVDIGAVTGSNRNGISINQQLVAALDKGTYTHYEYTFTIPADYVGEPDSQGLAFICLSFNHGDTGYLMNVKLTRTDDKAAKNVLGNGNFGSGLDNWCYGWDAWFMPFGAGSGLTEWSKGGELRLKVMPYDSALIEKILKKTMIHYSGTVSGADMSYIGQKVNLVNGKTYAISFATKELLGKLDETYYIAVANIANNRIGAIQYCNNNADAATPFATKTVDGKSVTYTFTMEDESGEYALVFASWDKVNATDVYIGDLAMYDVADGNKTSILTKGNYTSSAYGYYAIWDEAGADATEFTQQGYTVAYKPYNRGYFSNQKTMLHIKEYKNRGYDIFVQKTKPLVAGVEYTVSFDYHTKGGNIDETDNSECAMFFSLYAGTVEPGAGQTHNITLRGNNDRIPTPKFTTATDDGFTKTYTFTLTAEEIGANDKFYAGFYTMPDPAILTEVWIADLVMYETADENKTNLFLSDATETQVDNWVSYWGPSLSGNAELFTRPNIEYTAQYEPYNEKFFNPISFTEYIYGDANDDGVVNVLDLVNIKKRIAAAGEVFKLADVDKNGALDAADIILIKKHLLGVQLIEIESDYEIDLMDEFDLVGGADDEAAVLKDDIDAYEDSVEAYCDGTVYYVAANGNSSNSGTSSSAPISFDKVRSLNLKAGDAVVFKRGDTFRISESLKLTNGVSYGAYGDGAKPEILGSLKNYATAEWTSSDDIIWKVYVGAADATNVVLDDNAVGFLKNTLDEVKADGDFFYDKATGYLYLQLYHQNPGEYFDSIEIASTNYLFEAYGAMSHIRRDITIENITFKYATTIGIHLAFCDNIYIAGCELGWIGGAGWGDSGTRFGNAIQMWRYATNCVAESNYIYQIFDAAISFQGTADNIYTDLIFTSNLIEYCSMNFEFWGNNGETATSTSSDPDCIMENIYFGENILRFGGYGWGGLQRKGITDQAFILAWNNVYDDGQVTGFDITGNIFDVATCNYFYANGMLEDLNISANTYYQDANAAQMTIRDGGTYGITAEQFSAAIKSVDSEAIVGWIG